MFKFRTSLLARTHLSFLTFGAIVGIIFPVFASLFVEFNPGMLGFFWLSCTVAGLIIGQVSYYLMNFFLIRSLRKIAGVANEIRQKNLNQNSAIRSDDIVGDIVWSFNSMAKDLRELMMTLQSTIEQSSQVSHELQASGRALSTDAGQQQDNIRQLNDNLDQITLGANSITDRAADAQKSSAETVAELNQGLKVTTESVQVMTRLTENMSKTSTAVSQVEKGVEDISRILAVIRGIAEQTNLLALNAAIEAARAGEQGRGFAVVADEVRSLATRTQDATGEISAMIETLSGQSNQAVSDMDSSITLVSRAEEVISSTSQTFSKLAEAIKFLSQQNEAMSDQANQQTGLISNTHTNSEHIAAIGDKIHSSSVSQKETSNSLATMISELESIVSQYRV